MELIAFQAKLAEFEKRDANWSSYRLSLLTLCQLSQEQSEGGIKGSPISTCGGFLQNHRSELRRPSRRRRYWMTHEILSSTAILSPTVDFS